MSTPKRPSDPPLPRHELVRHEATLGPVHGLKPASAAPMPGHEQRTRGRALRVQARKDLFFQNRRIRAGEVFTLEDPKRFKANQMTEITDETPAKDPAEFSPQPFPFPQAAQVRRGIPGMPRTAQGTPPTLDARAGLGAYKGATVGETDPVTDDVARGSAEREVLE